MNTLGTERAVNYHVSHCVCWIISLQEDGVCSSVEVHHFPLPTQCCPVTVVYPYIPQEGRGRGGEGKGGEGRGVEREQQLRPLRLKLHQTFCLPNDRPFLRTINRHCFEHTQGRIW